MITYRAKLSLGLILPILIIAGGSSILMVYERVWLVLVVNILAVAFAAHMFATTYYQIYGTTLRIRCGFFYDTSINIELIKEIKETRNPISAPATSLDRIVITYNKFDTVIISPKDKEGFINYLKKINPGIKVILKKSHKPIVTS
jgi:hypothetical protein